MQLVKVGDKFINMDNVAEVNVTEHSVGIAFTVPKPKSKSGSDRVFGLSSHMHSISIPVEDATAFLNWLEVHADDVTEEWPKKGKARALEV